MIITLPNGREIYPTGGPLAIDVPAGSTVTFPPWWSRLDCLSAALSIGIGALHFYAQHEAEVVS